MKLETPPTDSENNFFSLSGKRKAGFFILFFCYQPTKGVIMILYLKENDKVAG
jgi:hypothetical protein